jgi:hypothetical protein
MGYPAYPEHPTPTVRRIYVASSWRNAHQPAVVETLRAAGYQTYDFKNPTVGYHNPDGLPHGFQWSEIDPDWRSWTPDAYREALAHPLSERGFKSDFDAMQWADTCVLLWPSGRSAHAEAGWMAGSGRRVYVLAFGENEPELMVKMFTGICLTLGELLDALASVGKAVQHA